MSFRIFHGINSLLDHSDEYLMKQVSREGDEEAFSQLSARWHSRIVVLCYRLLGSAERSEDLAQDTLLKIYKHRESYTSSGKFSHYIHRIALNLCRDELRRIKRQPECSLDSLVHRGDAGDEPRAFEFVDPGAPSAFTILDGGERRTLVREAIESLPEMYREIVILKQFQSLKFRDIAEVLGIPEGTAKSRMSAALDLLAAVLCPKLEEVRPQKQSGLANKAIL